MRLAPSLLQPQTKLESSREVQGWSKSSTVQTRCQTGLIPTFLHFQQIAHWAENGFGALSLLCDRTNQLGDVPCAWRDVPAPGIIPTEHLCAPRNAIPSSFTTLVQPGWSRPEAFLTTMLHPTGTESKQSCDTTGCKKLQGQVCYGDAS